MLDQSTAPTSNLSIIMTLFDAFHTHVNARFDSLDTLFETLFDNMSHLTISRRLEASQLNHNFKSINERLELLGRQLGKPGQQGLSGKGKSVLQQISTAAQRHQQE